MIAVALPDYIRRKQAYPRPDHGSVRPPSRHSRASVARGLVPNVVAVTAGVRNTALTVPASPVAQVCNLRLRPPAGTQSLWLHVSLHCHDAAIPPHPGPLPRERKRCAPRGEEIRLPYARRRCQTSPSDFSATALGLVPRLQIPCMRESGAGASYKPPLPDRNRLN